MYQISIVGLDLAKRVFQVHGAGADGRVLFRNKLSRGQLLPFFANLSTCVVAMEACSTAHYWAREIGAPGHNVKLVPPAYVKPFVKRQKERCCGCGSHRASGQPPDHAICRAKVASATSACDGVSHARSVRPSEDPAGHLLWLPPVVQEDSDLTGSDRERASVRPFAAAVPLAGMVCAGSGPHLQSELLALLW